MLTIFSTAKPFQGHIGIIQRNAIQSWKRIHPDVEIILFGDEEGAAEAAREFGLRHVPDVPRNEFGTKLLSGLFEPVQRMARHPVVCYVNCDIILPPSVAHATGEAARAFPRFLLVGRRWDTDITEPLDFGDPDWQETLSALVKRRGNLVGQTAIDYFAFPRGLYVDMPALVIGRIWWDHWLIWKARSLGAPAIDATPVVTAVHQNHDYGYHPRGATGVWNDQQAMENFRLAGGKRHLYTIADATHTLAPQGLRRNWKYHFAPAWRAYRPFVAPAWFKLMDITRPIRHPLGIRRPSAETNEPAGITRQR